ncbi:hypothetical protein BDV19DRAFT_385345 [Aspergillus venezuelensis]
MGGLDLSTTPGLKPPDGHVPQFHASWTSVQIGSVIAFGVTYFMATLFLALRYFQAVKLVQKIEVDLAIVTVAYGVALVYFVTMVDLFGHGWGKHMYDVSLAQLIELNKALLPNTLSYLICPTITKMAILSVLYRINPSFLYRTSVAAVGAIIFGYTLTLCIITGGPCSPLKDETTQCLEKVALSQAILNLISDFAIMALPIPTIHNLHLPLKQKVTVGCIMGLGSAVVICSIARLPYVIILPTTADTTYTQAALGIWTVCELNLGIICACAMRFKSLIRTYLPKLSLFSSRSRSRTARNYHDGSRSAGWRMQSEQGMGKRARSSYQLHSVQKGNGDGCVVNVDPDDDSDWRTGDRNIRRGIAF